jgi:DNA polymerase III sliding clamp (beta) subunit (PCNA family)
MSPFALPIAELKPALAGLSKVIAKRGTLPVLGNIKLERTKDGWIALTGTDLDHHVTVRLEQPGTGEPTALLVPYDELLKTCKACSSGEEILIERIDANAAVIKYRIGQQLVETKVESLPVEEFPDIPRFQGDAIAVPDTVRPSIHQALACASTDETRLILNGAYLDVSKPEASYVVGTDGRHLFSSNSFTLPLKQSLIIPAHKFIGWKEFNHDGEWQLKVAPPTKKDEPGYLQISSRRWRFITRQIEGNYPNWRQVVPGSGQFATTIEFEPEVEGVIQIIGRMPCDDAVNFAIGLERSDGKLALLGRSPGAEDWTRIEVAGVKSRGIDVRIFLNRNLLIKALQFGLTTVETIDAISPLRFSHGGRQMIVMPTRPNPSPAPTARTPTTPSAAAEPEADSQPKPQPAPEPAAPNEPLAPEQPERKPMPEPTNSQQNTTAPTTNTADKPALETALAQIEVVRGDFRNAIAGLNKLADALKQAQREQKTNDKDIQSVRATLRSLQTVRI